MKEISDTNEENKSDAPLLNKSLGFGHFSNADDEDSWRYLCYDGLESTDDTYCPPKAK